MKNQILEDEQFAAAVEEGQKIADKWHYEKMLKELQDKQISYQEDGRTEKSANALAYLWLYTQHREHVCEKFEKWLSAEL